MKQNNEKCPVCGRKLTTDDYVYERHQVMMHFCSSQCRDNFAAHPLLYSAGRSNVPTQVLKHRKLRLAQAMDATTAASIRTDLLNTNGVKQAEIKGDRLTVQYDLLLLTLRQLEQMLADKNHALADGWWPRSRRSWMSSAEANELDNLAMPEGACCSRPPPGAG